MVKSIPSGLKIKSIPSGLKIISWVYSIFGFLIFTGSIIAILLSLYSLFFTSAGLGGIMIIFVIIMLIPLCSLGLLFFFTGRELLKKQEWAKTIVIISAGLSLLWLMSIFILLIFKNIPIEKSSTFIALLPDTIRFLIFIPLIFNIIAGVYLLFNDKSNNFFSNGKITKKKSIKEIIIEKKIPLIIVFIILLICLFFSFWTPISEKPEIPSDLKYLEMNLPPEVQSCKDVVHSSNAIPASQRDTCYYKLAIEFKNPRICLEIEPNLYIKDCYRGIKRRL